MTVSRAQFTWGLSNGVAILAVAGAFWLGLASWAANHSTFLLFIPLILIYPAILVWASRRLRRASTGFTRAELRNLPKGSPTQAILNGFRWVSIAQGTLICAASYLCYTFNRVDLFWPLTGLIISVHFAPLGWLFRLRPYYLVSLAGSVIALGALVLLDGDQRLVAVGLGLGVTILTCAGYLVANAGRLADQASSG